MKSVLFPNSFFFHFHFSLYSILMVKLNSINQKACLINCLQFYLYQILFSIIFWIPF